MALFIPANAPQTGPWFGKLIRQTHSLNVNGSIHVWEAPHKFQNHTEGAQQGWQPQVLIHLWCRQESQTDSKMLEVVIPKKHSHLDGHYSSHALHQGWARVKPAVNEDDALLSHTITYSHSVLQWRRTRKNGMSSWHSCLWQEMYRKTRAHC